MVSIVIRMRLFQIEHLQSRESRRERERESENNPTVVP